MPKSKTKTSPFKDNLITNLTPLLMVVFSLLTGFLIGQNFQANNRKPSISTQVSTQDSVSSQASQPSSIVEEIASSIEEGALQGQSPQVQAEPGQSISPVNPVQPNQGKININSASQSQLETLKGIGPSKAKAIIDYRNQNGPFIKVEDLLKVKGIGPKTLENLRPYITI